jgi:hypothetical protein
MRKFNSAAIHQVLNYHKLVVIRALRKNHGSYILDEMFWEKVVQDDFHSEKSLEWTKKQVEYIKKYGWNEWWQSEGPKGINENKGNKGNRRKNKTNLLQ